MMRLSSSKNCFKIIRGKGQRWSFCEFSVKLLMKSDGFLEKLSAVERRAWKSFVSVVKGFVAHHKVANFREIVEELVNAYEKKDRRMSLKSHVLHYHYQKKNCRMSLRKNSAKSFTIVSNHLRNAIKTIKTSMMKA